jgi:hypothetical protein
MFVEIRTSSRVLTTPYVVQPITKLVSPLRGGIDLEIIPLLVHNFIMHVPITTIVSQVVEGSERSDKKQDEPINPSYIILDNRLESLELLSISVPLTPHQIGKGQEVILISNTLHVSKVYTTPIATFEDTLD